MNFMSVYLYILLWATLIRLPETFIHFINPVGDFMPHKGVISTLFMEICYEKQHIFAQNQSGID